MKEIWSKIEWHLKNHAPRVIETLNPPASNEEISKLETTVGKILPASVKEYLLIHNGQNDPSRLETLCEEGTLLSVGEIINTWEMLNKINCDLDISNSEWWHQKYLPLTDVEGDNLAVDLDSGEVVMHVHDSEIEHNIAPSFQHWFENKLAIFEEGKFSVDEGYLDYWDYDS